jgi:hypothetical protein
MFGTDIVADIAKVFVLYGLPLFFVIILFVMSVCYELWGSQNRNSNRYRKITLAVFKTVIAIAPMFWLDNSFGSFLSILRLS